jgi:hypothetical protein
MILSSNKESRIALTGLGVLLTQSSTNMDNPLDQSWISYGGKNKP